MNKGRIEAFSDGVIAIIITIMVLELKIPHGQDWEVLRPLIPVFASYVLSFVYIGIYWSNHHHLFQAVQKVNGATLWANLHLLFWLSLIPFFTGWMGENEFPAPAVMLYGVTLFSASVAYQILAKTLIRHHGKESKLASAIGKDWKGVVSTGIYALSIPCAYWNVRISYAAYIAVAILWIVPDRRIEKGFTSHSA